MTKPHPPPPTDPGWHVRTLGIVGVGLIGGSIGRAALTRRVADRVIGFGRDRERLEAAREAGVLTHAATDPAAAKDVELLVVCTPVSRIAADVRRFLPHLPDGAFVTDAGSVKGRIEAELRDLIDAGRFVGSHPLAGGEKSGWEHADAGLFDGRVCVLCGRRGPAGRAVLEFWTALGMDCEIMPAGEHDAVLARTSHLPHALAAALCLTAEEEDGRLTSTGFRDTTRVAAGDAGLWADILLGNASSVGEELGRLAGHLTTLRTALADRDHMALTDWLSDAARRRARLTAHAAMSDDIRTRTRRPASPGERY